MSETLDFSQLTDDQIVELAVGLAREAMSRNPALRAAFKQALVDEAGRVEAAARGSESQRKAALRTIEEQSARAEREVQKELLRARRSEAMARYLRAVADILGRTPADLTLVWKPDEWGRGGPCVEVNAGTAGADAGWHLVRYVERTQSIHAAPAIRQKLHNLQPWAREICAAAKALGLQSTFVLKGIDL